eukprot:CCRYP_017845-RB/>CCRYP_017845-RB protein AED:0.40 eAED:0.40 QI:0/-1/0/1/-1/0/1/0/129
MYTNIRTKPAIAHISAYLRDKASQTFTHYDPEALIEAIHIVFENNIIAFGDTYWQQISGTGMGISPAPPWRQSSTDYMNAHSSPDGETELGSTVALSTTSLVSGSPTHARTQINNSGMNSKRICKTGMV